MKYLVSPNPGNAEALSFAGRLLTELRRQGQQAFVCEETAGALGEATLPLTERPDCVIVLGGDGTILRQFHRMVGYDAPLWGINFGHLGYLTDCEPEKAMELLPRILRGEYQVEKRTLIEGQLVREEQVEASFRGLNEVCIHRGAMSRAVPMELILGGVRLRTIVADGLLLCTATGSTAYNYSAGGPLLTPEAEGLVITPICARWAENTPIVTGARDCAEAVVHRPRHSEGEEGSPRLMVDGYLNYPLQEGDRILVRGARQKLQMIRTSTGSFCERLSRKMAEQGMAQ